MKPKAKIKRTKSGRWSYNRPAFGFGKPERRTFATFPEAIKYATHRTVGGSCDVERAHNVTDQIASIPRWTPLWTPLDRSLGASNAQ